MEATASDDSSLMEVAVDNRSGQCKNSGCMDASALVRLRQVVGTRVVCREIERLDADWVADRLVAGCKE